MRNSSIANFDWPLLVLYSTSVTTQQPTNLSDLNSALATQFVRSHTGASDRLASLVQLFWIDTPQCQIVIDKIILPEIYRYRSVIERL